MEEIQKFIEENYDGLDDPLQIHLEAPKNALFSQPMTLGKSKSFNNVSFMV